MGNRFESDIPNMESKLINLEELLRTQIGYSIEGEAKQNAPVDTGVYRNNIAYNGKNQIIANASYSSAIEYGFSEYKETVKAHQRIINKAFGKDITPRVINISSHDRTMNRDPNPVMRNASRTVMKRDFNRIFNECWKGIMK